MLHSYSLLTIIVTKHDGRTCISLGILSITFDSYSNVNVQALLCFGCKNNVTRAIIGRWVIPSHFSCRRAQRELNSTKPVTKLLKKLQNVDNYFDIIIQVVICMYIWVNSKPLTSINLKRYWKLIMTIMIQAIKR